ncbi:MULTISPECIES: ogr/Delta-like zinc finger family protein [Xanthomonas]|uniref:ogr/Delta-like zinc finger family protein n=1 Tax=Xanthomonas TaxID=338 RepID=UPI0020129497|nr:MULTISPECIES: ogr/Delta-like zinc finger family protein [Xanthomonas]MCL1560846.1 ogr/Delta-like zinc finger family protein [Xanthomonas nasturtii]MDV2452668.1 ogr/Delta-like zinc finger family protein [Xanthomonas hortorum NBC5720]
MSAALPRRKAVFICEGCGSSLHKRSSYLTHRFLRNDVYVCDNPVCGASYTGHTELTGLCSPSGIPNAHSDLPPTPGYLRALALKAYRDAANAAQMDLLDTVAP